VACQGTGAIQITAHGGTGTLTYTWSNGGTGNPLTGIATGGYTVTITDQNGCSVTGYYIVGHSLCGGCPEVNTNNNVAIPCSQNCTTLSASAFSGAQTTAYSVGQIAYNPPFAYNTGTPILVAIDDRWSGVINLPFNFCFFGNVYNKIVVGSNGVVSFNVANANAFNSWNIPGPIPAATPTDLTNCIMGPWQDMDPTNQGHIYYQITGTYPCRKFEVSWDLVPMYGDPNSVSTSACGGTQFHQTQMIVLYETTNAIDVYIQQKGTCTGWNSGRAIEGIQNAAGTIAYTVPGRNATQWTASNDAWRFTPAGAPNYTIAWFLNGNQIGSADTITVCPVIPTTYTVQATYTNCDNSTITVSDSVYVTPGGNLVATVDSVHNPSCFGNDGAVYASYSAGGTVSSFGWSPGGANQTSMTNLPAGTYIFTVSTTDGCIKSDTVTLTAPQQLVVTVPDTSISSCSSNITSGSLTAHVAGGASPYSYLWSNGATTQTISGVTQGTYSVTVTDANGCTASASGTISISGQPITFNPAQITNINCGTGFGSIIVSLNGATPPITYTWSNNLPNSDTVSGLTAGTYNVTATDANGCSATASYTITNSPAIVIDSAIITNAGCSGNNTGAISLVVSGGSGNLSFNWSNGGTSATIAGLAGGTYTVTITDAANCSTTGSYTVGQSSPLTFGNPTITNVGCTGGNTGSITSTVNGGTGTIVYTWSNGGNGATISNLSAGTYNVTVTDSLGCSATAAYTVNQSSPLAIDSANVTPVACQGTGAIQLTVSGGTTPLTYTWSNGGSGNPLTGIPAGSYTVTITDANGCSVTGYYIVGHSNCGGCPEVNTNNNVVIPCSQNCATLSASAFSGAQTTSYNVNQIAYNPPFAYNTGTPILVATDDLWSGVINLPFNFCFFGNVYSKILVGSNGVVSFNVANANAFNSWNIPGPIPSANPTDLTNCIMSPWQDMDPTNQGTIYYQITGTYPCRKFEVSWYQVPMYGDANSVNTSSCGGQTYQQTQMIVLYETTNAIDVYIQQKGTCTGWNSGRAIEGIQNAAGTIAYTVPGRNATQWTASNDAWRFTPAGAPNYTIAWFLNGNQIGSADTITVCPVIPTTYTVQATYTNCDNSTITVSDSVYVTPGGSLTVNIDSVKNPTCNGSNTGAVYASYNTNNTTVTSFGWSPGGANQTSMTNLPAGTYVFTVTTANGCEKSDTVTLVDPPLLIVSVADTTVHTCSSGSVNGTLTANVSGGTPAYSYLWSNGGATATITGLAPGTYTVTVTDANGCSNTASGTVTVVVSNLSFGNTQITNVTCNAGNNGSIVVAVDSATPPVVYTWSNNLPNSDTVTGLSAGTYNLTVTDANGCSLTASYTITQPSPIVIDSTHMTQAGCTVGGTLQVFASGGTGTLTFNWSNGQSGDSLTGLAGGPYTVTITDANGCSITATDSVIAAPGAISFGTPVIVNVTCSGDSNGSITIVTSGGTGTIHYTWSTGDSTATISGLAAGTYSVTATDSVGCSASTSYIVNQPTPITFGTSTIVDASCVGSTGSITVTASGGTGTINFTWSNGGTTDTITGLGAGIYTVTATDVNGCTATASYTVNQPPAIVVDTTHISQATCSAGGCIQVVASGGIGTLSYSWSNGLTGDSICGVEAGTYTLTITDQSSCSITASYTVTAAPGTIVFGTPVIVDVACNSGNTGSITATTTGGTGTVYYHWSNGDSTLSISGLTAGTYTITASDSVGCSATASYTVNQPTAITLDSSSVTQATCLSGGCIHIAVSGGTGTLTYNWSNGQQSSDSVCGLAGGSYTLTVTDANSCTVTFTFNVGAAPNAITFGTPTIVDVTCGGAQNGSITISTSGGLGTIHYVWSNGDTTTTINGLAGGTYSVTASDAGGCSASTSYVVNEPSPISIDGTVITQATCTTGGCIIVSGFGGTGTLTYTWSNGMSGDSICGLAGANYTLTITDASGCSITAVDSVPAAPGAISFGNATIVSPTCHGGNNGSITITTTGGTGTVHYVWSTLTDTTATISGLTAGTYSVTAFDLTGCSASISYVVTEPSAITVDSSNITPAGCTLGGCVTVYASGGTGTLTFGWSNQQSGATVCNLAAGAYTVTVTDSTSCTATASFTVPTSPSSLAIDSATVINVACNGGNSGSITLHTSGGTGTVHYTWSTQDTTATISGLIAGTYTVTVLDNGGCSASGSYTVNQPSALSASIDYTHVICFDATNGTACAVVSGGTPAYTYHWNNNSDSICQIGLPVGIVLVTVTDANGCTAASSAIIGQSPSLAYNSQVNQPTCADLGFGTELLTPRGGTGSVTINIDALSIDTTLSMAGGDTTAVFNNVPTGNYTFTLTDSLGCTATGNFFVNAGAAGESFGAVADSTSCYGEQFNDGSITITPLTPANAPYTYSLNGGPFGTDSVFANLPAGTYTIYTQNTYGCIDSVRATVYSPAQVFVNATPDTIFTAPGVANTITVYDSNYVNPVYTWSPTSGLSCTDCYNPSATVSVQTVYYVTVSEEANSHCAAWDSVVIIVNGKFVMPDAFTPNKDGKNDLFGPVSFGLTNVKEFKIYDRWGALVHNATDDWDGTFNGKDQPAGTYVYYIVVETPDPNNAGAMKREGKQGSFTLLR
jgi:gliding motility-associated-like protein